jgi:hypothetical protein
VVYGTKSKIIRHKTDVKAKIDNVTDKKENGGKRKKETDSK